MKRNVLILAALFVFLGLLVWAGFANVHRRHAEEARVQQQQIQLLPSEKPAEDGDAPVDLRGKPAPGFTLTATDGKKISLADYKGKPVIVNFWATWCAPCKIEMPWFAEYKNQFAAQGLTIIGITEDTEQPKAVIEATAARAGANYPITASDHKVDNAYGGAEFIPSTFFIDRNGVIVAQANGLAPKEEMLANIKKIVGN